MIPEKDVVAILVKVKKEGISIFPDIALSCFTDIHPDFTFQRDDKELSCVLIISEAFKDRCYVRLNMHPLVVNARFLTITEMMGRGIISHSEGKGRMHKWQVENYLRSDK